MRRPDPVIRGWAVGLLVACSGPSKPPAMGKMDSMMTEGGASEKDEGSVFGPLEVGADWQSYTQVNKSSFKSETHGGRMVDTYVNPIGLEAFKKGADMPVGSILVKTSKDGDGNAGPIFVMEKRAPGFNKDHGDWWFAIHWAEPPPKWNAKLGGPVYWRTPSKKAMYCSDCHDNFVTGVGGVPEAQQAW